MDNTTLTYCYNFKTNIDANIFQRFIELYTNLYMPAIGKVVASQKNTLNMINSMDIYEIGVVSLKLMELDKEGDKDGLFLFLGRGYIRNVSNDCLVAIVSDRYSHYYYVIDDMCKHGTDKVIGEGMMPFLEHITDILHEVMKKENLLKV
uniref:Uncharacterized protein n=1 Tax=viral metagenome TaxID=1070528 RepID=A0A6C0E0P5_9ZZZZ